MAAKEEIEYGAYDEAGNPQRPPQRPGCYTTGEATVRAPWAIDGGRACMQARNEAEWGRFVYASPGCVGCERAERAAWLWWSQEEKDKWGMGHDE